jgi:hypothetical protein
MRKIFKYMVGLTLIAAVLASCDYRTAEQDVAPTVSPDGYPVATFTTDFTGTEVSEGDTIVYSIVFDKPIDRSVTFQITPTDESTAEADVDYIASPGIIQPFTTEAEASIIFVADDDPESTETFSFELGATSLADKYLVNPSVVNPTMDLNVLSVNDPTLLTIKFEWDTEDDLDILTSPGYLTTDTVDYWGTGGATGHNPEFDYSIWLADPPGKYWVYILDWDAPVVANFTLTLGLPDGTNQVYEGVFDYNTAADDFERDIFGISSWGYPAGYRILEVTVTDETTPFGIDVLF